MCVYISALFEEFDKIQCFRTYSPLFVFTYLPKQGEDSCTVVLRLEKSFLVVLKSEIKLRPNAECLFGVAF